MRRIGLTIFWPQYFDKNRTIKLGRRISLENATDRPKAKDVLNAAQNLKYYAEIDPQSRYPRTTWNDPGVVLIDTMGQKKSFVLNKLAPEVNKARIERIDQAKLNKVKKKHKKKKKNSERRY